MSISLTTPALLFPALSLLLLAYTNRFLGLSSTIRALYGQYKNHPDPKIIKQIHNLRRRVMLIRNMQIVGTASILLTPLSMALVFFGMNDAAVWAFGLSLVLMSLSLGLSVLELMISGDALNILLSDMEQELETERAQHHWLRGR